MQIEKFWVGAFDAAKMGGSENGGYEATQKTISRKIDRKMSLEKHQARQLSLEDWKIQKVQKLYGMSYLKYVTFTKNISFYKTYSNIIFSKSRKKIQWVSKYSPSVTLQTS